MVQGAPCLVSLLLDHTITCPEASSCCCTCLPTPVSPARCYLPEGQQEVDRNSRIPAGWCQLLPRFRAAITHPTLAPLAPDRCRPGPERRPLPPLLSRAARTTAAPAPASRRSARRRSRQSGPLCAGGRQDTPRSEAPRLLGVGGEWQMGRTAAKVHGPGCQAVPGRVSAQLRVGNAPRCPPPTPRTPP